MIAKILSSAASFNGVNYNEKKNEQGKSELLVAKNFGGLENNGNKEDFKNYLLNQSKLNLNVTKPQFHATISCKGTENTFEELKDVAEQWLEKMGYGQQPYLIYGHNDTGNNHVHIVSVRVDTEGKKIDHNFEYLRSRQALNEILGVSVENKAEKDIEKFSDYNFSTKNQFKLLFESCGWRVKEKDNNIQLIKDGRVQKSISLDEVDKMIAMNKEKEKDKNRKLQLTALLHKYKQGVTTQQLQEIMKSKFGVNIVFHTGAGHDKPYGYTVIDHSNKTIYKGSELLGLNELLITPQKETQIQTAKDIVDSLLGEPRLTKFELRERLNKIGFDIDANNYVKIANSKDTLYKLDNDTIKRLNYNSRLYEAAQYGITNDREAYIISKLYHVKVSDLNIDPLSRNPFLEANYIDILRSYISTGKLEDNVANNKIRIINDNNRYFIIDDENKVVVCCDKYKLENRLAYSQIEMIDANEVGADKNIDENMTVEIGKSIFVAILQGIGQGAVDGGGENKKRKRKKHI